jgi:hypothetical protein
MKSIPVLILLMFCGASCLYPQGYDESWKIFDDTELGRIDITIDTVKLNWIYANPQSDSEHVASAHFKNKYIDESIDSIGFRLRGNTSRDAKKKSFKISFNSFIKGKKFYGVEKLNLNGEHNDPSVIRSKLSFNHFKTIGLAASRSSHIEVYINGLFFGLYLNVEHIDEEFLKKNYADDGGNLWKCLYPADLKYIDDNPDSYKKIMNNGTPAYELSTNESAGDFNPLARLIKCVNRTSDAAFPDSAESLISIPEVLKYTAHNILTGSWDDYWALMNNYYLYYEPKLALFHIIPYDYDNTFGVDWANVDWTKTNPYNKNKVVTGSRPLIEKILANQQYRNLYTHFLEFFRDNVYDLKLWDAELERLKIMITNSVSKDPYYPLDYGFTTQDFQNSYSASGYFNKHVKFGLRQFVNLRVANLAAQLNYVNAKPIAYQITFQPEYPSINDSIHIDAAVFGKAGIKEVSVHYSENDFKTEQIFLMKYSPVAGSKIVEEADRYSATIPPVKKGSTSKFLVYVTDSLSQTSAYPRKGGIELKASGTSDKDVVINEFLADNKNSMPDPAGEHDDWVELYNRGSKPVLLSGIYMTDDPAALKKWRFPLDTLFLNPDKILLVWCDEQEGQQGVHAGFKLSKSGEFIALVDADGVSIIDSLSFGAQATDVSFGRFPDGSDFWKTMSPTPGTKNFVTHADNIIVYPDEYKLEGYPNPFNPSVKISFTVKKTGIVVIKIYDIIGREISSLINEEKKPGNYNLIFNGAGLASGVYLCRMKTGNFEKSIKLQLLK